jgi:signal transduction histidine kinase
VSTAQTRWWNEPTLQRPLAYGVAVIAIAISGTYGAGADSRFSDLSVWAWLVAPATIALSTLVRSKRWLIYAIGAAVVAYFNTDEAVYLAWCVAALVFLSLIEDRAPNPIAGWTAGVMGWIATIVTVDGPNLVPLFATLVGWLGATLLRGSARTAELTAQTDELRAQATWLEQRTNLARELHDVVGHHVTAMVVQAEAGQVTQPQEALRRIADAGRTALQELDALVVHLRDPSAPLTVSAPPRLSDIDELLAVPLRQNGVNVSVDIDPSHGLDEIGTLTLYRVAQEALTNVARHAAARSVWVEVQRLAGQVRLRVSDDGVGPPTTVERGTGLLGITERVTALDGSFELTRRPGGGAMIDVLLPAPVASA